MRLLFTTSMALAVFTSVGYVNAADLGYPNGYNQNGSGVYGNRGQGSPRYMGIRGTKSGDCYEASNKGDLFGTFKRNRRNSFSLNCQDYNGAGGYAGRSGRGGVPSGYAGHGTNGHAGNGAYVAGGRAGYGVGGSSNHDSAGNSTDGHVHNGHANNGARKMRGTFGAGGYGGRGEGGYGVDASGGYGVSGSYGDKYASESFGSGWYLRGDLGYASLNLSKVEKQVSYIDSGTGDVVYSGDNFFSADLDSSWSISGGLGYQVSSFLRVDAILKHIAQVDFKGDSSTSGSGYLCDLIDGQSDDDGDTCTSVDTAKFSATLGMANAYLDLGSFAGFTPYVGGGIGGAYVHWSDMNNDTRCDNTGSNCTSTAGLSYENEFDGVHGNKSGWRFAYAAHAGASYQLTSNMKFDAGYSFTNISGGDMFGFASGGGVQGRHGDIKVHEVKAGIRYSFH